MQKKEHVKKTTHMYAFAFVVANMEPFFGK